MGEHQGAYSAILGKIAGLLKQFNTLASQGGLSPAALAKNLPAPAASAVRAANSQEGMLGSLILEHLISPVFSQLAAHFIVNTPQGSFTGTVTAIDVLQGADALDSTAEDRVKSASDDARYKKGAGKGTEALILSNTNNKPIFTSFNDGGAGFFTSPFNTRAQKRLESSLIEASHQLMDMNRFAANPA